MSFEYIRNRYRLNVNVGSRVRFKPDGRTGEVTGASGPYVKVQFHGRMTSVPIHPDDLESIATEAPFAQSHMPEISTRGAER
jgi:hypothetical protein